MSNNILGIHVRGIDFYIRHKKHPLAVTAEEYIEKATEVLTTEKIDKIFLATDDLRVLEIFKHKFGKKVLYYENTFRASENVGTHLTQDNRPLHHYKLGLEVLRDIYAC